MLDKIKIVTYNTCWETTKPISQKKKFGFVGKLCKKNVGVCRENIVKFINKNYPYDFISLQEVVFDSTIHIFSILTLRFKKNS